MRKVNEVKQINNLGLKLIKEMEGCSLIAYDDSTGVWIIGVGSTRDVYEGMVITEEEAEQRPEIKDSLKTKKVKELCIGDKVSLPEIQKDIVVTKILSKLGTNLIMFEGAEGGVIWDKDKEVKVLR